MEGGLPTGWLPSSIRKTAAVGRGAPPPKGARTAVACKRCKKAKAKCDMSRPCRRCLYTGKAEECSAGDPTDEAGPTLPPPSQKSKEKTLAVPLAPGELVGQEGGAAPSSRLEAETRRAGVSASNREPALQKPPAVTATHGKGVSAGIQAGSSLPGAGGEESMQVMLPSLRVLSVSPALARRYATRFTGPAGTSLLLWVHQHDAQHVVESMLLAAKQGDPSVDAPAGTARMLVMRHTFAELHQCSLRVKPDSASQVTLHFTWNKSMQEWDEAMQNQNQGALPAPIARILHDQTERILLGTYGFDELRSTCCLYDYATAVSRSNGGGESSTQAIIDHVVTSEQSKALLQDWIGLRYARKSSPSPIKRALHHP
jgi:hypothetical protein